VIDVRAGSVTTAKRAVDRGTLRGRALTTPASVVAPLVRLASPKLGNPSSARRHATREGPRE